MNTGQLIKDLRSSNLIAECTACQGEFKLSDALLFDGMGKFPKPAEERRLILLNDLKKREDELKGRKVSADVTAEKKAIEIGFGKMIEKFIPAYEDLKLKFCECRALYDPLDVIVFRGLLQRKVDLITFLEIKSGESRLNNHQKMIKKAISDGKVGLEVLK
jgi:predicted Holliday junction resolvase-like endonuclease